MLSFKPTFSLSSFIVIKFTKTKTKKHKNYHPGKFGNELWTERPRKLYSFLPPLLMFTFYLKGSRYLLYKQAIAINIKFHFISLNFSYKLSYSFLNTWLKYSKSSCVANIKHCLKSHNFACE